MNTANKNEDIIRNIFIKLSELEGKYFKEKTQCEFVSLIYSDTKVNLPTIDEVKKNKPILLWKSLHTGDLALFSDGISYVLGIVVGDLERHFCFVNPKTSIVQIMDFCENVGGYKYINGFKVINNG